MSNTFCSLVRIGTEPEVKFIPSGKGVLTFSAAVTTGFGDKKQTMWLRVTYWNNPERMASMLTKGAQIVVAGELSQREYTKDGQTKTSLELNANMIDLISGQGNQQQQPQQQQRPAATQQRQQPNRQAAQSNNEYSEDIPF